MTHNNMAQALQEEGKLDDAVTWYQQGLQLDPRSARIHRNLASLLAEQENYEEATSRYEIALALAPEEAETHIGLGSVLHEQGHCRAGGRTLPRSAAASAGLCSRSRQPGRRAGRAGPLRRSPGQLPRGAAARSEPRARIFPTRNAAAAASCPRPTST